MSVTKGERHLSLKDKPNTPYLVAVITVSFLLGSVRGSSFYYTIVLRHCKALTLVGVARLIRILDGQNGNSSIITNNEKQGPKAAFCRLILSSVIGAGAKTMRIMYWLFIEVAECRSVQLILSKWSGGQVDNTWNLPMVTVRRLHGVFCLIRIIIFLPQIM